MTVYIVGQTQVTAMTQHSLLLMVIFKAFESNSVKQKMDFWTDAFSKLKRWIIRYSYSEFSCYLILAWHLQTGLEIRERQTMPENCPVAKC